MKNNTLKVTTILQIDADYKLYALKTLILSRMRTAV